MNTNESVIAFEKNVAAQNYEPLPVVLVKGDGVYVWDIEGKRYVDMMSAYSAVSHGHCHPRLVRVLAQQAATLTLVSRAFHTELLGSFLQYACALTGFARACPMNSGAEAVETALKAARKWGYVHKGIPENQAEIIVCQNNFHGRTITIISASTEKQYYDGFGPLTPGFVTIPYNDSRALAKAITANTCAFLVEPMQGEAGMIVPTPGYLAECARICKESDVLLICDEVQTGLGRTGKMLACQHDNVQPDGVILGKALGGGMLPVSLFLSREDVMSVFTPGDHGSTFGGNPLAARVGLEALAILEEEHLCERAQLLGEMFLGLLQEIKSPLIKEVRGIGLFIGIEIKPGRVSARDIAFLCMKQGILTKDTHSTVLRFAPPLVITREQITWAAGTISAVFASLQA